MFTGARKTHTHTHTHTQKKKKQQKKREMDWQMVASYFTVKSTDIFCSVVKTREEHTNAVKSYSVLQTMNASNM